jgi:RES domain-containing protein
MMVFRLSKTHFANDLSGSGAEQFGGRWNSKGFPMIYASENRSLCVAEIAVHMPLGFLPVDFSMISIEIPSSIKILEIEKRELPKNWNSIPFSVASQYFGDVFLKEKKYCIMKVPSVIVPGEFNYLINPLHPSTNKINIKKIEPFSFDERLFNK